MGSRQLFVITSLMGMAAVAGANSGDCVTKGDGDGDCRIAINDVAEALACMSGPQTAGPPVCGCYDFLDDGDIDLLDLAALQRDYTGDDLIPGCGLTADPYEPGTRAIPPSINALEVTAPDTVAALTDPTSVYLATGEECRTEIDLSIPGRGPDFVWARTYRSRNGSTTTQGNNWDHSYNVRVEASGNDLVLHDGRGRADVYTAVSGPAGTTWCADEFFREITEDAGGDYICTFARGGSWTFLPLDGSPWEGRLAEVRDRNGNTLTCGYDLSGRLVAVTDTLGRSITIAYNPAGQISSVTDFVGRQVTYDYYGTNEAGGSPGDLRSVTSPPVIGTPNGNDFPSGKTTSYTYSKGFADSRLNHNLLTITDARGNTRLTNVYASTQNPADLAFDRVVRQVIGEPNDIIDFVYESRTPTAANGYAVVAAWINDRNGRVQERGYDRGGRCMWDRRYTGSANPTQPTSSGSNLPTNPLRPGDPAFFEMVCVYNRDALLVRCTQPELNVRTCVYESELNPLAAPRTRGNLRACRIDPGPRGGDQPELVTEYEYDALLNGNTNQVTREIDPRGNDTVHEYDANGNKIRITHRLPSVIEEFEYNAFGQVTAHVLPDNGSGHRRRDESTYYAGGQQNGYLQSSIVDATGAALTTTYEYDAVGNVTRIVDARGNDTLRIVNQLDQVVRLLSRPADPNNPIRYEVDTFYDENDNVVRVDVQNRDENGVLGGNTHFTTEHVYDILDRCVRTSSEVSPGNDIVNEFHYDGEGNCVEVRSGEAVAGTQPSSTVTRIYDERDLLFRETLAAGDPMQSTTQVDYDGNGNCVQSTQGLEGATPRVSTFDYDGYDRCVRSVDPAGNEATRTYDENDNIISERVDGELSDGPGSGGNVRLCEQTHAYDALDRLLHTDVEYFDPVTQNAYGNGVSTTTYVYSDNSQLVSLTDDNSHSITLTYDTVCRRSLLTDARGNTRAYTYDDNSNVIRVTDTEKSDLGLADEVFITDSTYDGLDRCITTTDSSGNTSSSGYDSRDNLVVSHDAAGSEVRCAYDGLSRPTVTTTDMDGDGADGDGTDIVRQCVYDANSRLILATDGNGNPTVTTHDPLNRPTSVQLADGATETYAYDPHNNLVSRVDANGSQFVSSYDPLNRLTNNVITPGPGVAPDTTFQTFTYDGLSRLVHATDDDSQVTFAWDSLSNLREETLQGDATSATYDGVGNRLSLTYPSGRVIDYVYDALDRPLLITDGPALVASYLYVGPDRVALQQYGNGSRGTFSYDGIQGVPNPVGDFGVKRCIGLQHSHGPNVLDQRTFAWDNTMNKVERRDTRASGPQLRHAYDYDRSYRMTFGLEEDAFGLPVRLLQYSLDAAGNWTSVGGFGGNVGSYTLDAASPPSDFQVNQYTSTPRDARQYDENGNVRSIVSGPQQITCAYDAHNRLVVRNDPSNGVSSTYGYDPLGRRIRRTVASAILVEQEHYRYFDETLLEDQDPNGATRASYVHGVRASEIVCVESGGQVYYQHSDDVGNVVALSDPNGAVFERYECTDFGLSRVFDAAGAPLASSSVGNPYRFRGMRLDEESGWYLDGREYLDPINGRYLTRVQSRAWGDGDKHGNGFSYAGGNPWSAGNHVESSGAGLASLHGPAGGPTRGHGGRSTGHRGHVPVLKAPGDHNGHVTVLKARGGHHGHVTVLKARDHHGHVTVLKARDDGHVTVLKARGDHRGHVTVLKARGDHRGHVTVLKARGEPPFCPGCGARLCRCTDSMLSAARDPHRGHVTVLKSAGKCPSCGSKCRGHNRGHVTVLKLHGGVANNDGGGIGSSAYDLAVSGIHQPGGSATGATRRRGLGSSADDDYHNGGLRTHRPGSGATGATRRQSVAGGPPHCPGCGAMLCRCTYGGRAAALGVSLLENEYQDRARPHDKSKCVKCRTCEHGTTYHKCKEGHPRILPAANNISSR